MNFIELTRRSVLAAPMLAAPLVTSAQDGKPIEWVVGYAAGGGSDAVARTVAEAMSMPLAALESTPVKAGKLIKARNIRLD